MKNILLALLMSTFLFAATTEQVEAYLSISNADEQLVELEQEFSRMQNNLNSISQDQEEVENYDMQLLSIRFKEYLQKHLSDDEMDAILKAYRNVLLLQFTSAVAESQSISDETLDAYIKELTSDPQMEARIKLVEKISKEMYDKSSMAVMYDSLMKLLLTHAPGGDQIDEKILTKCREASIKHMEDEMRRETLYATRDFSMEELVSLEEIAKLPVIHKETKVVFGATAYALEEFFLSLASRYDIKKHQTEQTE
jgi:hypothetical protein